MLELMAYRFARDEPLSRVIIAGVGAVINLAVIAAFVWSSP